MATDGSSVWITGLQQGILDRIDPTTNEVADRYVLGGSLCGIAIGPDDNIWIADLARAQVHVVEPATGANVTSIATGGRQLWDLKAGFGSVWVVVRDKREVLRIDPSARAITDRVPIGPLGSGLAVLDDAVWVADETDGTIRRIDPTTNVATIVATLEGGVTWFSDDGHGRLLVSHRSPGDVTIIDAESGAAGQRIEGWITPLDGAIVGDAAWIPDGAASRVRVVDATSGTVLEVLDLPGALNPWVAEPGFGDAWVLDFGGRTVWRIRP